MSKEQEQLKNKIQERKKEASTIYMELLGIMDARRRNKFPKFPKKKLAQQLGVQESTVNRKSDGTYKLTVEDYLEWCDVLKLDPLELLNEAVKKAAS